MDPGPNTAADSSRCQDDPDGRRCRDRKHEPGDGAEDRSEDEAVPRLTVVDELDEASRRPIGG
ncbi:hypothetical protein BRC79_04150 [Halobacteriales archaeon QH_8_67_27]|nr:MAG: hypothetical protein BRC79_04150 [Halobacteriales archaeon QH_8_67_27]